MREELKKKALENQDLQTQIELSRNEIICKYEVQPRICYFFFESFCWVEFSILFTFKGITIIHGGMGRTL